MKNILNAVKTFSEHSYNAKRNTQANLSGRTHWADDDTLAFFGCKITSAFDEADGKLFIIKYNQQAGFDRADGRVYGVIVFDLFGNVVVDTKRPTAKHRDKEAPTLINHCISTVDLITQTGRDAKIRSLKMEIDMLEGAE